MDHERLKQIESLFSDAIGFAEFSLDAFLSERCGDDVSLKQSVMSLIEMDRHLESSGFLESPVCLPVPAKGHDASADELEQIEQAMNRR